MTSEHLPRTSVPLSLTILPGTVLPDLPFPSETGPGTRWGCGTHGGFNQPRLASLCPKIQPPQCDPKAARLMSQSLKDHNEGTKSQYL